MPAEVLDARYRQGLAPGSGVRAVQGLPLEREHPLLVLALLPFEHRDRGLVQRNPKSVAVLGVTGRDRGDLAVKIDTIPGEIEDVALPQTRRERANRTTSRWCSGKFARSASA
jgi:hypothetical protein